MKLSLSGFLFEDSWSKQSIDFYSFCKLARACGYDGVELRKTQINPNASKSKRKKFLKIINNHGLEVTCLTARGLPEISAGRNDFFMNYLELCNDMNCKLLKIDAEASWLRKAAEAAQKMNIIIASNSHINTELETNSGTQRRMRAVDHDNYALLYDSMHLYIAGENYLEGIELFKESIKNVLLHSVRPAMEGEQTYIKWHKKCWILDYPDSPGCQDWTSIIKKLKCSGYDGLFTVIENSWPIEKREGVAEYYAKYFKQLWKDL